MPLKLVTGPANSAKAGVVLDAVRAARRREPWLVVPTRADVAHFERELASDDGASPPIARVTTFDGLMWEIARRAGYAARPISGLQRERLVALAIADAPLEELAEAAGTAGFLQAAIALVAELERSLITPQRFAAAVRDWPEASPAARAAAAIYDRYARALERLGRVDGELFAWRALDALRAAPAAWGATPVFLYGFDDLTGLELDAIETLARIADADVTVSLTWERDRTAFAGRAAWLVGELEQLAAAGITELPPLDEHYAPSSQTTLHHIERHLFEPGAPRVAAGDAVELLVAGGERAEAELVAAELLRLQREDGVAPEEIAVVMRSPERNGELLAHVLDSYGVPYALDRRVGLDHTALGRGLLALVRCALRHRDADAGDLLAYLRTPGRVARLEQVDRFELRLRRDAITDLDGALALWEQSASGRPLRELDRLRGAAADGASALLAALEHEARTLFAAPHRGRAPVLDAAEEVDAHALATVLRALEQLAELARSELRRAVTSDALLGVLERLEVPLRATAAGGGVVISDPLAIRARRFDTVIVYGLQAASPPQPEPFLSDEERLALNRSSGLRLVARTDRLAEARYLFYAAVSRANRRLVLSCRDSDEEGNPLQPSFFIDDVAALLDALPRRHRPLSAVTWPLEQAPTERERARALALAGPRVRSRPLASLGPAARAALRQREVLSAGALETYARCPVRWLIERELAPERFEPDPEAVARGSCVHRVLEQTLRRLDWPLDEGALPEIERVVREVVAEESDRFVLGTGAAAQAAAAREIAADVTRLLAHEARAGAAGFAPAELELEFGMDGDRADGDGEDRGDGGAGLGPLALRCDGVPGELRLRGKIDRVDLDRAGRALVRDYKSGAPRGEWPVAKWRAEDQLQVALYMVAVRELLRREPVGGLYQPLRGEDLRARGIVRDDVELGALAHDRDVRSADELAAELDAAAARACELAARLRGGELTATPETCSSRGCAYPGICRGVDQ